MYAETMTKNTTKHNSRAVAITGWVEGRKRVVACQAKCACGFRGGYTTNHLSARAEADAHRTDVWQGRA